MTVKKTVKNTTTMYVAVGKTIQYGDWFSGEINTNKEYALSSLYDKGDNNYDETDFYPETVSIITVEVPKETKKRTTIPKMIGTVVIKA